MKSLFVALALLLSPLVFAQDPPAPGPADLTVTAQQREQIRALIRDGVGRTEAQQQVLSEEQLQALSTRKTKGKRKEVGANLLDDLELTEEQRREIEAIRAAGGGRKEMHAVLTTQQKEQLKALKRERRGKGKGKAGGERERKHREGKAAAPVAETAAAAGGDAGVEAAVDTAEDAPAAGEASD